MNRREMLQLLGVTAGVAAVGPRILEGSEVTPALIDYVKPDRPVTAVVIGAGRRGGIYMDYAAKRPDELDIVGIAEPLAFRKKAYSETHNIDNKYRFDRWEEVFDGPRFADAVIITTQDAMHYGPAMAALEAGYDILLEKPIAPTWKECFDILRLAQRKNAVVGVCHVLRYSPYFQHLRHVTTSGVIGEIVHVEHTEPVGYLHYSHSYNRGPWGRTAESNPILLSKSCHDLDILRWIIGTPCKSVSSFGSRKLFCPEGAPEGAGQRCVDCPIEQNCRFSALKIYLRDKEWPTWHFYLEETNDETLLKALTEGGEPWDFGRCVFNNNNDVLESQFVNMKFGGNVNASFSLIGLTAIRGRHTRIFGTKGNVVGNNREMLVYGFTDKEVTAWSPESAGIRITSGHHGGDHGLMRDWVQAVSRNDSSLLASSLEASMESHFIGFKAGESLESQGGFIDVNLPPEVVVAA
jgi:predicted dehydrogenase